MVLATPGPVCHLWASLSPPFPSLSLHQRGYNVLLTGHSCVLLGRYKVSRGCGNIRRGIDWVEAMS